MLAPGIDLPSGDHHRPTDVYAPIMPNVLAFDLQTEAACGHRLSAPHPGRLSEPWHGPRPLAHTASDAIVAHVTVVRK